MSECVVLMEIPTKDKACGMAFDFDGIWYCPVEQRICHQPENGDIPSWCPILCQLPEGHGRLVDADELADDVRSLWDYKTVDGITATTVLNQTLIDIRNCPTIVPGRKERNMSDLIDREAVREFIKSYRHSTDVAFDMEDHLDEIPAASPWHRVEDELPPNAKHPGAFCPKVRVLTRWGVTDGWFNPDMGRNGLWCVLLWFFMGTWKEDDIDFERGDKPKMVLLSQDDVIAWMPIEPPKEENDGN